MIDTDVREQAVYVYALELEANRWYIGSSRDPERRYQAHATGQGAAFTKLFTPLRLVGYRLATQTLPALDEDREVIEYMAKYGIDNVRGGTFSQPQLSDAQKSTLQQMIAHAQDLCFKCGAPGHFGSKCTNVSRKRARSDSDERARSPPAPAPPPGKRQTQLTLQQCSDSDDAPAPRQGYVYKRKIIQDDLHFGNMTLRKGVDITQLKPRIFPRHRLILIWLANYTGNRTGNKPEKCVPDNRVRPLLLPYMFYARQALTGTCCMTCGTDLQHRPLSNWCERCYGRLFENKWQHDTRFEDFKRDMKMFYGIDDQAFIEELKYGCPVSPVDNYAIAHQAPK